MNTVFWQTQLYKFLLYCNDSELEKNVLDCGAGGKFPPLALFAEYGYRTSGIEIDDIQLERANEYGRQRGVELNISKGDIRGLPFDDESVSFVFSYNTIFHMSKADIAKTVGEIKRVLRPGGLCFINFLTVNDFGYGQGTKAGEGEYLQREGGHDVIHTYYEIDEGDLHFKDMDILFKENRIMERIIEGDKIRQGYIDYIVRKRNEIC